MRIALVAALSLCAATAEAAGRWYAWLDRVSPGASVGAAAGWTRRGVPADRIPSERFFGMDAGFVYLVTAETLFEADARLAVDRLQAGGFRGTGIQYFSDALPAGVIELLGREPVFAVDADVDAAPPAEILALTRGSDGDVVRVIRRHADGSLSTEASHAVRLYDLPRVTEGERTRVMRLSGDGRGLAVVFEAAFRDTRQEAIWHLVLAFREPDIRVPPAVFFVPGARQPVPTKVVFSETPEGLRYDVRVEGLRGGARTREMVWRGDRFVDASAK